MHDIIITFKEKGQRVKVQKGRNGHLTHCHPDVFLCYSPTTMWQLSPASSFMSFKMDNKKLKMINTLYKDLFVPSCIEQTINFFPKLFSIVGIWN